MPTIAIPRPISFNFSAISLANFTHLATNASTLALFGGDHKQKFNLSLLNSTLWTNMDLEELRNVKFNQSSLANISIGGVNLSQFNGSVFGLVNGVNTAKTVAQQGQFEFLNFTNPAALNAYSNLTNALAGNSTIQQFLNSAQTWSAQFGMKVRIPYQHL